MALAGGERRLMLKGPRGERRPADVIGNAVHIMKIATGEEQQTWSERAARLHLDQLRRTLQSEHASLHSAGLASRRNSRTIATSWRCTRSGTTS
jgi:hypothetical protein